MPSKTIPIIIPFIRTPAVVQFVKTPFSWAFGARLFTLGSFGKSFGFSLVLFTLSFALALGPWLALFAFTRRLLASVLACIAVSLKTCLTAIQTPIIRIWWPFSLPRRVRVDSPNIHGIELSEDSSSFLRWLDHIVSAVVATPPVGSSASWQQCRSPRNSWEPQRLYEYAAKWTPGFVLIAPGLSPSEEIHGWWRFPSSAQQPTPTSSRIPSDGQGHSRRWDSEFFPRLGCSKVVAYPYLFCHLNWSNLSSNSDQFLLKLCDHLLHCSRHRSSSGWSCTTAPPASK